jgi:outer membrane PBP1 activator LpoA protein
MPSIALVLPTQQTVFAQAAEAVRLGFFAAHEAARSTLPIQVIEVDGDAAQLQAAIGGAHERGVRVVVGPLLRSEVNAVFEGGYAVVPLVALNYPDRGDSAPATMIALGLSAEAEAQYVVRVALAEVVGARRSPSAAPRFVVLSGPGALERRIAQAYVAALRAGGEVPTVVDIAVESGDRVAKLLDPNRHEAVFLALDAGAAALLRARIPRSIPVFGTSLLNPGAGAATPEATALANDLDGVRFVDMPWLVRADAVAGADRLRPAVPLPAELARLYALGADAYQVAQRWSAGETRFTIEGMTGRLSVDRAAGPRVERTPAAAIYRQGAVEREEIGR